MNTGLTFYNETGRIVSTYSGQNPQGQKAALSEYSWIDGKFDGDKFYVAFETPIPRPVQGISLSKLALSADGVDEIIISWAAEGSTVMVWNKTTGTKIFGELANPDTFSTEESGEMLLKIERFPYLPFEAWIDAH
jgi:hypothetical protein